MPDVNHDTWDHTGIPGVPDLSGAMTQAYVGRDSIGALWETITTRREYFVRFTLPEARLVTDIQAYQQQTVDGISGWNAGIWTDDGTGRPDQLIAYNFSHHLHHVALGQERPRWLGVAIGRWLEPGDYLAAVQSLDAGADSQIAYDTDGNDRIYTASGGWLHDPTASGGTDTDSGRSYSIRVGTIR